MKRLLFLLSISLAYISCEKVIPFDGDVNTPKLVINSIFQSDSSFKVHVSSSRSVIDTASFKNIDDAIVTIKDRNENIIETLNHVENGFYKGQTFPQENQNYILEVNHPNYANITASDSLPSPIIINSVDTSTIIDPINGNRLYKSGNIEIQGEASQLSALILGAKPGMQVADICAGAGGKSLVLADIMKNQGRILSLDINQKRLKQARLRFKRAGVHNVETRLVDLNWSTKGLEKKFDLVLIDAPCSGIGTWARSPDSRFNFNEKKLVELVNIQYELLSKGSTMVAPGGKLAYVICSILPEEGVDQIEKFKNSVNSDFSEINMSNMWKDNLSLTNSFQYPFDSGKKSITINPATHKMDGFFISMFQRKR